MTNKRPDLYFRRLGQTLVPESIADAVLLEEGYPATGLIRASLSYARSTPQNRFYWAGLAVAIENLDDETSRKYPTKEKLHRSLLEVLGYVSIHYPLGDGAPRVEVDSAAFDKMDGATFQTYFERARAKFAAFFDFDPWAEIEARMAERKAA